MGENNNLRICYVYLRYARVLDGCFLFICLKFRKSSCLDQFLHFSAMEMGYGLDLEQVPSRTRTENFPLFAVTGYSMLSGNLFLADHLNFDQFSSYFKKRTRLSHTNFIAGVIRIVLSSGSNATASTLFGAMRQLIQPNLSEDEW